MGDVFLLVATGLMFLFGYGIAKKASIFAAGTKRHWIDVPGGKKKK